MSDWSLKKLLHGLHDDVERRLQQSRELMGHQVAKGDSSETVWLSLLGAYLPKRYQAARAFVVDSKGAFSQQLDVVIFDRQYTPLIFQHEGQTVIPAESVYAVFEAKQSVDAEQVRYAQQKVASVRALHRTSLPVPHIGGIAAAKAPAHVLGGVLTFESEWNPPLGDALQTALKTEVDLEVLDLGCVAAKGYFAREANGEYSISQGGKPATSFLLELISRLQNMATVPMIDIRVYAAWLAD